MCASASGENSSYVMNGHESVRLRSRTCTPDSRLYNRTEGRQAARAAHLSLAQVLYRPPGIPLCIIRILQACFSGGLVGTYQITVDVLRRLVNANSCSWQKYRIPFLICTFSRLGMQTALRRDDQCWSRRSSPDRRPITLQSSSVARP